MGTRRKIVNASFAEFGAIFSIGLLTLSEEPHAKIGTDVIACVPDFLGVAKASSPLLV
jgi:hypothetical protein